jgi:protein involved in polysaccharide export with SLBB domain
MLVLTPAVRQTDPPADDRVSEPQPAHTGESSEVAGPKKAEPAADPVVPTDGAKPLPYVIEPPDILLVRYASRGGDDPVKIDGQRLVRPDGTVSLGPLGTVRVSGRTLVEARAALAEHLARRLDGFDPKKLTVEVVAFNSKVIYLIVEGAGGGEQVYRLPATGNETVLDAVTQVNGLPAEALKKHTWVARPAQGGSPEQVLPVDWKALTQDGNTTTNYVLLPGDRVYIKSRGPKKAEGARGADAVGAAGSDPVRELEAVLKALRAARSREEQRRAVEDLDALTKALRERLKDPEGAGRP